MPTTVPPERLPRRLDVRRRLTFLYNHIHWLKKPAATHADRSPPRFTTPSPPPLMYCSSRGPLGGGFFSLWWRMQGLVELVAAPSAPGARGAGWGRETRLAVELLTETLLEGMDRVAGSGGGDAEEDASGGYSSMSEPFFLCIFFIKVYKCQQCTACVPFFCVLLFSLLSMLVSGTFLLC